MNDLVAPNIPRVLTALAEWCACALYIFKYPKRLHGVRLWGVLVAALVFQCFFLDLTGTLPVVFWMPCMAAAVGLMLLMIAVCCDLPLLSTVSCTMRAFLLAEFAASLGWQLYCFFAYRFDYRGMIPAASVTLAVYVFVFLLMYRLETLRSDPRAAMPAQVREILPALVISLSCFFMSNLSFVSDDTPFSASALNAIYYIRTLVDLAGVAMLYAFHLQRREQYIRRELDSIQSILQNQYVQYRQSRESIDLINRKYHDLKHQIAVLRAEKDPDKRLAFLDEMENEIKVYEAENKTGNSVLDTVLTGKSLYCAKHQIELTCVADGARLDFMSVMDICTIFGNALDNAIECELRIPEKKKRLIHLTVHTKKDFLLIQCENYCEERPRFQEGLPVTTKADAAYHGYGIKSIRYTAEKYGGSMTISNANNWFEVNVVIPIAPGG